MYEIWSLGHKPFEGYTNLEVAHVVEEGYRLPPPAGCPRLIYQRMIDCWYVSKIGCMCVCLLVLITSDSITLSNFDLNFAGTHRLGPAPRSLTCCSPFPDQRQNSFTGLRRTQRHTHRLRCSGHPWRLGRTSTLACSVLILELEQVYWNYVATTIQYRQCQSVCVTCDTVLAVNVRGDNENNKCLFVDSCMSEVLYNVPVMPYV